MLQISTNGKICRFDPHNYQLFKHWFSHNPSVSSDEGLTLETSATHHIPQAKNIRYQLLLIKPVFSLLANAEKTVFSKLVFPCSKKNPVIFTYTHTNTLHIKHTQAKSRQKQSVRKLCFYLNLQTINYEPLQAYSSLNQRHISEIFTKSQSHIKIYKKHFNLTEIE